MWNDILNTIWVKENGNNKYSLHKFEHHNKDIDQIWFKYNAFWIQFLSIINSFLFFGWIIVFMINVIGIKS